MIELKYKVLASEPTKSVWRKNSNSDEWQNASKLDRFLFGKSLNQNAKCECIEDLFMILKTKNINEKIIKKMEKEFIFKKGVVLQTNGHGVLTESSSDEKCMRFLNEYPNAIKNFKTFPKDWKSKCADFVGAKKVVVLTDEDYATESEFEDGDIDEGFIPNDSIDFEAMKVNELKDYIESKGVEVPEGKKAELKAFAKTL